MRRYREGNSKKARMLCLLNGDIVKVPGRDFDISSCVGEGSPLCSGLALGPCTPSLSLKVSAVCALSKCSGNFSRKVNTTITLVLEFKGWFYHFE